MNRRCPDIFKALFEEILDRTLACAPGHGFKFHNLLHAIDSTTIDLCLAQYDWAHYRKHKGAIKLHTELDLSGNIPCFVVMSNGKISDIRAAKNNISIVPDSIYTFDKGYYDLRWFQQISNQNAFFVTRIKNNAQIEILGQHHPPNVKKGILCDENHPPANAISELLHSRNPQRNAGYSTNALPASGKTKISEYDE